MMTHFVSIFIVGFFVTLAVGIPIVYGLAGVSILYLILGRGFDFPPDLLVVPMVQSVNSFILLAVPLFFFLSRLMNESGLTDRLFAFVNALVGHFRGGLGHVNVLISMIFAGMSGSATADAAGPGAMEYKAMVDQGYSPEFSAGVSLGSALIGPIIPPSIPVMIYAAVTELSPTALLMAGLVPGILIGLAQMGVVAYSCRNRPKMPRASLRTIWNTFAKTFLVLLTPFVLIIGISAGIFTATEAAAIACIYALFIACVVYRTVSFKKLISVTRGVVQDTAVVMFVLSTATFYGWMLTRLRIPVMVVEFLMSLSSNSFVITIMVVIFLLAMGCFFSTAVGLIIVAPIVHPVALAIGFDPIHFGIVCIVTMVYGSATPPVGSSLYALMQVTKLPMEKLARGVLPFLIVSIAIVLLMIFVPQISLFFPNWVLGR